MPAWTLALIVLGFVAIDAIVLTAVFRGLAHAWNSAFRDCRPVEPAPDAVRQDFQSFRLGAFDLGLSVHVAVDDRFLHLYPARVLRWAGVRPASVPWEKVAPIGPRTRRTFAVRLNGQAIVGPRWALALARPTNNPPA